MEQVNDQDFDRVCQVLERAMPTISIMAFRYVAMHGRLPTIVVIGPIGSETHRQGVVNGWPADKDIVILTADKPPIEIDQARVDVGQTPIFLSFDDQVYVQYTDLSYQERTVSPEEQIAFAKDLYARSYEAIETLVARENFDSSSDCMVLIDGSSPDAQLTYQGIEPDQVGVLHCARAGTDWHRLPSCFKDAFEKCPSDHVPVVVESRYGYELLYHHLGNGDLS